MFKHDLVSMTVDIIKSQNFEAQTNDMGKVINDIYNKLCDIHTKQKINLGIDHKTDFKSFVEAIDSTNEGSSDIKTHSIDFGIYDDYIVCLEDNTNHIALKRYLKTKYNLSWDQYLTKWGLPKNYPSCCKNYSKLRSKIAKEHNLGCKQEPFMF